MERRELTNAVWDKLREQVDRTDHLLTLVPPDREGWRPDAASRAFTVGALIGHLMECLAGFCAVLHAAHPDRLGHFLALRDLPVDHSVGAVEARRRLVTYGVHIEEGFTHLADDDLRRRLPTVFVPAGETVLTLLLGNLEHLVNHKFQLFLYLKLMGQQVGTADLYVLRG